jgi:hypothetical protein
MKTEPKEMQMPVIEMYIIAVALGALAVGVLGTRVNTRAVAPTPAPAAKAA